MDWSNSSEFLAVVGYKYEEDSASHDSTDSNTSGDESKSANTSGSADNSADSSTDSHSEEETPPKTFKNPLAYQEIKKITSVLQFYNRKGDVRVSLLLPNSTVSKDCI